MKTEHTKGPWRTEGFENLVVNSAEGYTLTLAAGGKDACLDELKANARLIAAAPELLEALYAALPCVEESEEFDKPNGPKLSVTIRDLLAQVEGNA